MNDFIKPDLLDSFESLPYDVQDVLNEFSEMDNTYPNCENLVIRLNAIGYTIECGLEAEPYNLQRLPE